MRLEQLSDKTFHHYEQLTAKGDDEGICYCAFWHMKWASMAAYDACKRETPELLRETVLNRMKSGFHVGVLAYDGDEPVAWVSVAPLNEVYWCWRRAAVVGEDLARKTAGITCLTVAPAQRGQGVQQRVAEALIAYGRERGWERIEAYPFAPEAVAKMPDKLAWPGLEAGYVKAGFERVGPHWLSQPPEFERWIYAFSCAKRSG